MLGCGVGYVEPQSYYSMLSRKPVLSRTAEWRAPQLRAWESLELWRSRHNLGTGWSNIRASHGTSSSATATAIPTTTRTAKTTRLPPSSCRQEFRRPRKCGRSRTSDLVYVQGYQLHGVKLHPPIQSPLSPSHICSPTLPRG